MLDENGIISNWSKLINIVETTFEGDRREKLLKMYSDFEDRMCLAPASGREHFHNAFPGGYVDHVLRVVEFSKQVFEMWKSNGAYIDYTEEELIFSALHHDLGKIGDTLGEYYTSNDSTWHRENQGLMYKFNPGIHNMTVTDRTFFILQQYGIQVSQLEWIGIRLTDGMYEDGNKTYLVQSDPGRQLKTNIQYVLHMADSMAARIEFEKWKMSFKDDESPSLTNYKYSKKFNQYNKKVKEVTKLNGVGTDEEKQKLFDNLFLKK